MSPGLAVLVTFGDPRSLSGTAGSAACAGQGNHAQGRGPDGGSSDAGGGWRGETGYHGHRSRLRRHLPDLGFDVPGDPVRRRDAATVPHAVRPFLHRRCPDVPLPALARRSAAERPGVGRRCRGGRSPAARRDRRRGLGRAVDRLGARGPDRGDRARVDGGARLDRTGQAKADRRHRGRTGPRPGRSGGAGGARRAVGKRADAVHRLGGGRVRHPVVGHGLGVRIAPAAPLVAVDGGGAPE